MTRNWKMALELRCADDRGSGSVPPSRRTQEDRENIEDWRETRRKQLWVERHLPPGVLSFVADSDDRDSRHSDAYLYFHLHDLKAVYMLLERAGLPGDVLDVPEGFPEKLARWIGGKTGWTVQIGVQSSWWLDTEDKPLGSAARTWTRPRKIRVLTWAAKWLYEDDPEFVEGGCGDVSHALLFFGRRLGMTGLRRGAGEAVHYKDGEPFWHAWVDVDGKPFDGVATACGYRFTITKRDLRIWDLVCSVKDFEGDDFTSGGYHADLLMKAWVAMHPTKKRFLTRG